MTSTADDSARLDASTAATLGRAPIRAGALVEIAAPPETIWEVLLVATEWPTWYSGVTEVKAAGSLEGGSRFSFKAGPAVIEAVVEEALAMERLRFSGSSLGTKATYAFVLDSSGKRTRVSAAQAMSGLAARPMKPVLQGVAEKAVVRWLDALRARVEG